MSYHFKSEIDEILGAMHEAHQDCDLRGDKNDHELNSIYLQFQLLRQNGYKISVGMSFFLTNSSCSISSIFQKLKKITKSFNLPLLSNFWELKLQILYICVMHLTLLAFTYIL